MEIYQSFDLNNSERGSNFPPLSLPLEERILPPLLPVVRAQAGGDGQLDVQVNQGNQGTEVERRPWRLAVDISSFGLLDPFSPVRTMRQMLDTDLQPFPRIKVKLKLQQTESGKSRSLDITLVNTNFRQNKSRALTQHFPKEAEKHLSDMVVSKALVAKIDRPMGIVCFQTAKDSICINLFLLLV
ncbi:hypothetical protein ACE6H2_005268 [Prunus campanulata]